MLPKDAHSVLQRDLRLLAVLAFLWSPCYDVLLHGHLEFVRILRLRRAVTWSSSIECRMLSLTSRSSHLT